jgi:CubicO group peptidase (beta-lactamase class C family)
MHSTHALLRSAAISAVVIGSATVSIPESADLRTPAPAPLAPHQQRLASDTSDYAIVSGPVGAAVHARLQRLADSGLAGAVIVEKNDTVVLRRGYGLANRERRILFSPSTIAQIGSNTKQFTAAAILDLQRSGSLRVGDSLGRFFPFAPPPARAITIHQLLTHSSGMAEYCGRDFDRASRDEFLRRCLALPLATTPGTPAYSNPAYAVLAAIVEQVSGQSIDAYLKQRFFIPLQMARTGYTFPGVPADAFAVGYTGGEDRGVITDRLRALGDDYWNLKGNGGMQASATDMYRWYRALRSASSISEQIRTAMFTPHVRVRDGVSEGYGWVVRTDTAGALQQVSHSGSDGVFLSTILWSPQRRLFIYVVTNSGETALAKSVVREIANAAATAGR